MIDATPTPRPAREHTDARDLQARLYREIGISAVAAALRFMGQPDPGQKPASKERDLPAFLRDDERAA